MSSDLSPSSITRSMLLKLSLSSFFFTNFLFFKKNYRRQLFYLSWVNNQLHSLRTAPMAFLPLRRFITQSRFCGNSISSFSFVYLCLSSFRVFYSFGSFFGNFKSLISQPPPPPPPHLQLQQPTQTWS